MLKYNPETSAGDVTKGVASAERTNALENEVAALRREIAAMKTKQGQVHRPVLSHTDAPGGCSHPVRGRGLTELELHHDERIRTLCFVIMASAVVYGLIFILRAVLVPFFLALAIKYLLTPLINLLSCNKESYPRCKYRLPRGFAILMSMTVAVGVLSFLGVLIVRSVGTFSANAGIYNDRLNQLVDMSFTMMDQLNAQLHGNDANSTALREETTGMAFLQSKLEALDLSSMIATVLDSATGLAENLLYILLFLVFMLVGDAGHSKASKASNEADAQIFIYIKGKLTLSCLVGGCHGLILWSIGSDLWLVFCILTFSLNLVPNVGMFLAVTLPMPLVALDPRFSAAQVALAFVGPGLVGVVSKDVLEPLLIGGSTSLQPVALMLAIMVWGSVWGLTGMILAVPMTAVMRIHLAHIEHPLTRYVASALDGSDGDYHTSDGGKEFML
tara:strand:+ start:1059 stop:2393 length:1335 start_codon:yes stop_codon:yes gene_type:complete